MVVPRIVDRQEKRQQLLDAAKEVFVRHGFASTRVADIAERAGVAKGTVYEYFRSKEELFFALFESTNRLIRERADDLVERYPSPRERLAALFLLSGTILIEQRELYPMMNLDFWVTSRGSAYETEFTSAVEALYRQYRELVADTIREGQRAGEFRSDVDAGGIATVLVSTFDGLGMQCWLDEAIDPVGCSAEFVETLCRGLCREGK
jgi:AcrR family transcriptional regulator